MQFLKNFLPPLIGLFMFSASARAISVSAADKMVKDLFQRTSIKSTEVFCGFHSTATTVSSWQCRTINYLQDKTTGAPVKAFWMTFNAPARLAGAQHYYIAADAKSSAFAGRYHVFSNGKFDLTPGVDEVYEDASVEGDFAALARIEDLRMHILGTENYGRGISIVVNGDRGGMDIDGPIFAGYDSDREILAYHSHLTRQYEESDLLKEVNCNAIPRPMVPKCGYVGP